MFHVDYFRKFKTHLFKTIDFQEIYRKKILDKVLKREKYSGNKNKPLSIITGYSFSILKLE